MADRKSKGDPPPLLVPRYVRNLNALAERCGMVTRNFARAPKDEDELPTLRGEWQGTTAQLVSTGLFAESMVERMLGLRQHSRFVSSRGSSSHPELGVVVGNVAPTEDGGIVYEINFDELPRAIRSEGTIEILEYQDWTGFHGLPADLLASGRCTARQMPKRRDAISDSQRTDNPGRKFRSRRQPDGAVLVLIETDLEMERRIAYCRKVFKRPAPSDEFSEDGFETVDVGPLLERFRRPPAKA
jgi:hypothetical protein